MSRFRSDHIIRKTRKDHTCTWCHQKIEKGQQMIKVAGVCDDFWEGKFHPECWRAEHHYWDDADPDDGWPGFQMARGSLSDRYADKPEFTDRPITHQELLYPYQFVNTWRLNEKVDQEVSLPGVPNR